jgi:hypothetical protein
MGPRLIKGDSRKNNYKQGCSPKPTDGSTALSPELKTDLTNTISLKDVKSRENGGKRRKMKTSLAGPKERQRR